MAARLNVPEGLSVTKVNGLGWRVIHTASGKELHPGYFARKTDIRPALDNVAELGIDWDQDADTVLAAVEGRND